MTQRRANQEVKTGLDSLKSSIFDQIGGEKTVRELVRNFYDLIETHPDGKNILRHHMNGHGLAHAREEQFNFLCGFMGGPQFYLEKHRHMNVKNMHAHVPIREEDAVNWLNCMDLAIEKTLIDGPAANRIRATFKTVAHSLVNEVEE